MDEELRDMELEDGERWFSVLLGSALVLGSLRRGPLLGGLLAVTGGTLMYRGITGRADLPWPSTAGGAAARGDVAGYDEVDEASLESFPASDAPSWTPTTSIEPGDADEED